MTIRYCKTCTGWHDLNEPWPDNCSMRKGESGPQIVRDIDPHITIAADKATGKPAMIGGRAQHREFLRRNNYVEVGNDSSLYKSPAPRPIETASKQEIRRAIEQVRSRT